MVFCGFSTVYGQCVCAKRVVAFVSPKKRCNAGLRVFGTHGLTLGTRFIRRVLEGGKLRSIRVSSNAALQFAKRLTTKWKGFFPLGWS